MAIETNLALIFWNTLSAILSGLPYFILIILGIRYIGRKLDTLIKNLPLYIQQYDDIKMKHYQISKALERR